MYVVRRIHSKWNDSDDGDDDDGGGGWYRM